MNTKKLLRLSLISASLFAQSAFGGEVTYRIEKKNVQFTRSSKGHLLISKNCNLKLIESCEAVKILHSVSFNALKSKIKGDVNPGAVFCGELGGKEQLGVDKKQDETMFCRFKDGSRVSCSSLLYFAQKNDKK